MDSKSFAYTKFITACLEKSKYMLGSVLAEKLVKKFRISEVNARAAVSRAAAHGSIQSTKPVSFGKGQFVYTLDKAHFDRAALMQITEEHRPPLHRILKLLAINNGIISWYEALKVAASPLKESSTKQDSLDKLVWELAGLQAAHVFQDDDKMKYIIFQGLENDAEQLMPRHRARMKVDAMFVRDVCNSLYNTNLLETKYVYRNQSTPSIGAQQNNLVWDAYGYSKTTGINPVKGVAATTPEKQTLVVLDVVVSRDYTDYDLQGFIDRVQIVLNSSKLKARKLMPVVVCRNFESTLVQNRARRFGLMSFNLGTVYGEKIFSIIDDLQIVKFKESFSMESSSDLIENIESSLSALRNAGQDGNLRNIKGDLFESLMYRVLHHFYSGCSIVQGKKYKKSGRTYEFDYIIDANHRNEKIVFELKGFGSTSSIALGDNKSKNTVQWFFANTLPVARAELLKEHGPPKVKACYITTASFRKDALEQLEKYNAGSKLKPHDLDVWYDGTKLLKLLEDAGLSKIKTLIERYYVEPEPVHTPLDVSTLKEPRLRPPSIMDFLERNQDVPF
jgi:hypothetical protein